jgi:hypothetical protein
VLIGRVLNSIGKEGRSYFVERKGLFWSAVGNCYNKGMMCEAGGVPQLVQMPA